jgi:predicted transglutaminase-like cysteine proteinase
LAGRPLISAASNTAGQRPDIRFSTVRTVVLAVLVLSTLVLGAAIARPTPAAAATAVQSFFNTKETQSSDLKAFTKWTSALARFASTRKAKKPLVCGPGPGEMGICGDPDWIKFLKLVKEKSKLDQVRLINAQMNKAKYVKDNVNWGQDDYWETPYEFMQRFGDCEDYAIIKYLSLRFLGWDEQDLRVVAVKDLNLKVGHAILIVYMTAKSGQRIPLVLDNQIQTVVKADSVRHYQPVFSINEKNWWRHVN